MTYLEVREVRPLAALFAPRFAVYRVSVDLPDPLAFDFASERLSGYAQTRVEAERELRGLAGPGDYLHLGNGRSQLSR